MDRHKKNEWPTIKKVQKKKGLVIILPTPSPSFLNTLTLNTYVLPTTRNP